MKGVKGSVRLIIRVEEGMGQNIYYEEKETARIVIDISQISKATKENVLVKEALPLPLARNDSLDKSTEESQAPEKVPTGRRSWP